MFKKTTNLNPAPKSERTYRLAKVGIVSALLALAVSVTPLLSSTNSGALASEHRVCVQATSDRGEFIGNRGSCDGVPNWSASSLTATASVTLGSGPQLAILTASGLPASGSESYEWFATPVGGGQSIVIGSSKSITLGQQVMTPGDYTIAVQAREGSKISQPAAVAGRFTMKLYGGKLAGWSLSR